MWFKSHRIFRKHSAPGREVAPEDILMDALNVEDFNTDQMEGQLESALSKAPFLIGMGMVVFGIALLLSRAGFLQIAEGEALAKRAEENKVFSVTLPAPRGIIYDEKRNPLVTNTPSFEVVVKKDELPEDAPLRHEIVGHLAQALGKTPDELKSAGFDPDSLKSMPEELALASDISREEVLEIQSHPERFSGIYVRTRELRTYPGPAFAHVIGYVGKVTEADTKNNSLYQLSDVIGKDGIEAVYENQLRGTDGKKLVEINSANAPVADLSSEAPVIGKSLVLNIDADLQRVLYDSLKQHIEEQHKTAGSAVILDPRDGAVRALVSYPSFDPNVFRQRISQKDYQNIFLISTKPFFDRAIAGEYPSGSVIKPMMAVAALSEHILDPTYKIFDSGSISIPNPYDPTKETVFLDWRPQGWVDVRAALQWSANVYFYIVGGGYKNIKGLGITKIDEYMKKFGFGEKLGIDLPGEAKGLVPGPQNIAKTRPGDPVWRLGDTYHTAIGQGSFQATPLQIAAMTAAVANGGTLWQPQIVRAMLDENGNVVETIEPKVIREHLGDTNSFQIVREGMRLVAAEGTARAFFANFPVEVAGKTGTAQTGFQKNTHGWFTAFAPYQNPELVMVVMAEDVTANTSIATPVTRDVLYWYFTQPKKQEARSKN